MSFLKKIWQNRVSSFPNRRTLIPTDIENTYDVTRAEGTITTPGDAFNAENMNDLEERIASAMQEYIPLSQKAAAGGVATLDLSGKVLSAQLPAMNYIPMSQKAATNGVASLDASGKVPSGQLPAMNYIPTSQKAAKNGVASLDGNGKVPAAQLPAMNYIPTSQKGVANGVATLGADKKVPASQLPDDNLKTVFLYSGNRSSGNTDIDLNVILHSSGKAKWGWVLGRMGCSFPGAATVTFSFPSSKSGLSLSSVITQGFVTIPCYDHNKGTLVATYKSFLDSNGSTATITFTPITQSSTNTASLNIPIAIPLINFQSI